MPLYDPAGNLCGAEASHLQLLDGVPRILVREVPHPHNQIQLDHLQVGTGEPKKLLIYNALDLNCTYATPLIRTSASKELQPYHLQSNLVKSAPTHTKTLLQSLHRPPAKLPCSIFHCFPSGPPCIPAPPLSFLLTSSVKLVHPLSPSTGTAALTTAAAICTSLKRSIHAVFLPESPPLRQRQEDTSARGTRKQG